MIVDTDDLVTTLDIARAVGMYPSAVSNWAARHEDFPKPVYQRPKCRLYLWSQVREWLTTPRTYEVHLPAKIGVTRTLPARFPVESDNPAPS